MQFLNTVICQYMYLQAAHKFTLVDWIMIFLCNYLIETDDFKEILTHFSINHNLVKNTDKLMISDRVKRISRVETIGKDGFGYGEDLF